MAKLKRPRRIMLMVKAGQAVDDFIKKLVPLLSKGDIIIGMYVSGSSCDHDTNDYHHHGNLLSKSHDDIERISQGLQSCGDLLVHRKGSAPNGLHEENSFLPDDDGTSPYSHFFVISLHVVCCNQ